MNNYMHLDMINNMSDVLYWINTHAFVVYILGAVVAAKLIYGKR